MMETSTLSPVLHFVRRPIWIAVAITMISCAITVACCGYLVHRMSTPRLHVMRHHKHHHLHASAFACQAGYQRLPQPSPAAIQGSGTAMPVSRIAARSWWEAGIERTSDENVFVVQRGMMYGVLHNLDLGNRSIVPSVRVVSTMNHGELGFRLLGIAPHSLPATIGFQNGDVITAINGLSVAGQEVERLYFELPKIAALEISIERNGRPETHTLVLDPPPTRAAFIR